MAENPNKRKGDVAEITSAGVITGLQQQLQQVTAEREALTQQLQEVTAERDELTQQLQQANTTLTDVQTALSVTTSQQIVPRANLLTGSNTTLLAKIAALEGTNKSLMAEGTTVTQQLHEANSRITQLQSENENLKVSQTQFAPATPPSGVRSLDSDFTQNMNPASYLAQDNPRVTAAKQVSDALMANVVIGSQQDKIDAMVRSGFSVKGQSNASADESDDEGENESDDVGGVIPGRVFTVTKDYTEEGSRRSRMYDILKTNGLIKKRFSLLRGMSASDDNTLVEHQCCGIAGSLSISQVCKTSFELVVKKELAVLSVN